MTGASFTVGDSRPCQQVFKQAPFIYIIKIALLPLDRADALPIADRVDEVVYVCRFNRALRKHIHLYIKELQAGKNEVPGIVLNGLTPRRIEYYSNYRYYRSYKNTTARRIDLESRRNRLSRLEVCATLAEHRGHECVSGFAD